MRKENFILKKQHGEEEDVLILHTDAWGKLLSSIDQRLSTRCKAAMDTIRETNANIAKIAISSMASSRAIAEGPRPKLAEKMEMWKMQARDIKKKPNDTHA